MSVTLGAGRGAGRGADSGADSGADLYGHNSQELNLSLSLSLFLPMCLRYPIYRRLLIIAPNNIDLVVRDLFSIYKTRIWMQQLDKRSSAGSVHNHLTAGLHELES